MKSCRPGFDSCPMAMYPCTLSLRPVAPSGSQLMSPTRLIKKNYICMRKDVFSTYSANKIYHACMHIYVHVCVCDYKLPEIIRTAKKQAVKEPASFAISISLLTRSCKSTNVCMYIW